MPAIIALVIIIIVIYVIVWLVTKYFQGMWWLLEHAGPDVLLVCGILTSALVMGVFARALFRVWSRPGWRTIALVPAGALLTLVWFDVLWALDTIVGWHLQPRLGASLLVWLDPAALKAFPNAWIIRTFQTEFPIVWKPVEVVAASAAVKVLATIPLLMMARGLKSTVPGGPDPVWVQYFAAEAWTDLRQAWDLARRDLGTLASFVKTPGMVVFASPLGCFTWSILIAVVAGVVLPGTASLALGGLLFVLLAAGNRIGWALSKATGGTLAIAEHAVTLVRSGYAVCPYSRCHEPISQAHFKCPTCAKVHEHLVPDRHGALYHRCTCDTSLPTLSWLGKGRLLALCPKCHQPMNAPLYRGSAHIPIYGAPDAGKTMLVTANMHRLLVSGVPGVRASLLADRDEREWSSAWKPAFERGTLRDKTMEKYPDALQVSLRRGRGLPTSLFLYDPAGDVMLDGEHLDQHRFLKVFDGVIFAIDPWSIPLLRDAMKSAGAVEPPGRRASDLTTQFQRLVSALADQGALRRGAKSRKRLAVVVAKAELPGLAGALGLPTRPFDLPAHWEDMGVEVSTKVRQALHEDSRELVLAMETQFAEVRYFAASAIGRPESKGGAFTPWGVEHPVLWILSSRFALRRPLADRVAGLATEVAAVAAALAPFIVVPWLAWSLWLGPKYVAWLDGHRPTVDADHRGGQWASSREPRVP